LGFLAFWEIQIRVMGIRQDIQTRRFFSLRVIIFSILGFEDKGGIIHLGSLGLLPIGSGNILDRE
jgi:hypothetical protein